jgi:hypothetical protein
MRVGDRPAGVKPCRTRLRAGRGRQGAARTFLVGCLLFFLAQLAAPLSAVGDPEQSSQDACPQYVFAKHLVAPAPDSEGVPPEIGALIVSGPADVVFLRSAGESIKAATRTSVPSSMSSSTLAETWGALRAFVIPTLAHATKYSVYVQDTAVSPDCPEGVPHFVGSFTTS